MAVPLFIASVCVCARIGQRKVFRSEFSCLITWVPGIELKSLNLKASILTSHAMSFYQPPKLSHLLTNDDKGCNLKLYVYLQKLIN